MSTTNPKVLEAFKKEFIARGLEGKMFEQLAERLAEIAPIELETDLVHRLHEACNHPDYEYETTEAAYKGGYEKMPEKGEGWESNIDKSGGCDREDPVEYQYWRRPKHFAQTDEVNVWDLPGIRLEKIDFLPFLALLRNRIDEGRLLGGRKSEGFHSKYEYISRYGDLFNSDTTEFYSYSWNVDDPSDNADKWPFKLRDYSVEGSDNSKPYLMLALPEHPFRILIDGTNPEENSWISVLRANKTYGPWRQLFKVTSLPINTYTLLKELDRL